MLERDIIEDSLLIAAILFIAVGIGVHLGAATWFIVVLALAGIALVSLAVFGMVLDSLNGGDDDFDNFA